MKEQVRSGFRRRTEIRLILVGAVGAGLISLVGCSRNVDFELENRCDVSLSVQLMYSSFDEVEDAQFKGVFAKRVESLGAIELEADTLYDMGYLWIKPEGGRWGFEVPFVIDADSEEPSDIRLEGARCDQILGYMESFPEPSPSTSD